MQNDDCYEAKKNSSGEWQMHSFHEDSWFKKYMYLETAEWHPKLPVEAVIKLVSETVFATLAVNGV